MNSKIGFSIRSMLLAESLHMLQYFDSYMLQFFVLFSGKIFQKCSEKRQIEIIHYFGKPTLEKISHVWKLNVRVDFKFHMAYISYRQTRNWILHVWFLYGELLQFQQISVPKYNMSLLLHSTHISEKQNFSTKHFWVENTDTACKGNHVKAG